MGFSGFNVTTTNGTLVAGPSAANIDPTITAGSGVITGGDAISDIGLNLAAAFTTGNGGLSLSPAVKETISYSVTTNLDPSKEPTSPAGDVWAIDGVTALSAAGAVTTGTVPTGSGAPTIQITEAVCLGQTLLANCSSTAGTGNEAMLTLTLTYNGTGSNSSFSAAVTGASCADVAASFGCALIGTGGSGGVTFNPIFSAVVIDTIVLNHPGTSTYDLSFSSFTDPFRQTELAPEPSTFILLGSALAGLGALRLRKRT
jgi:hypothetical protein